jgi:hypothetical protein
VGKIDLRNKGMSQSVDTSTAGVSVAYVGRCPSLGDEAGRRDVQRMHRCPKTVSEPCLGKVGEEQWNGAGEGKRIGLRINIATFLLGKLAAWKVQTT